MIRPAVKVGFKRIVHKKKKKKRKEKEKKMQGCLTDHSTPPMNDQAISTFEIHDEVRNAGRASWAS